MASLAASVARLIQPSSQTDRDRPNRRGRSTASIVLCPCKSRSSRALSPRRPHSTIRGVHDLYGRPLRNLRLSVTDRCNLRCQYCMPEMDYVWLPREDVLNFEEMSALVDVFIALGVDRLRLTGGEPLLRRDLASLVAMLAPKKGLK